MGLGSTFASKILIESINHKITKLCTNISIFNLAIMSILLNLIKAWKKTYLLQQ